MRSLAGPMALVSLASVGLAACATSGTLVDITAEASGSPYFSLSRPGVYKSDSALDLTGRVCRLVHSTVLSPPRVRLEHIDATGKQIEHALAGVGAIYRGADQACSDYTTQVNWTLAEGDTIRACFDRGKDCSAEPATKAVVAVPANPGSTP